MDAIGRVYVLESGPATPPSIRTGGLNRARVCTAAVTIGILLAMVRIHISSIHPQAPTPPQSISPLHALSNLRPVLITITTPSWTKEGQVVSVDRLGTDRTLWREMHFDDWDRISRHFREPALLAMIRAYEDVFVGPAVWSIMTAADWDEIPQPVRSVAYLRMIWHWAAVEAVGAEFGLPVEQMAQTIGAIVMAESWFEHRAINENRWGNRDFGLAQCSDHCRETLAEMAARGDIPFRPVDDAYFNPWTGTRVATVWFERELMRAGGDVDLATRAYHRGLDRAHDEKGDTYLKGVQRLRERYIRAQGQSETWRWLSRELRAF